MKSKKIGKFLYLEFGRREWKKNRKKKIYIIFFLVEREKIKKINYNFVLITTSPRLHKKLFIFNFCYGT